MLVVDAGDAADQGVADGPMLRLVPAPGGKFLAGLTAGGRLVVWLADFTKVGIPVWLTSCMPSSQVTASLAPCKRLFLRLASFTLAADDIC